jgi:DNA-binding beta-propeller fold protein YncE
MILTTTLSLCSLGGCGGHKPPGPSPFPAKISLSPATSASVQAGSIISFSASAQNVSNSVISASFTYQSSNTDILNIASNGVACAGKWDAHFVTCTAGASGVAQVTASALGATSAPTLIFVHPPIDNIQISQVVPVNSPPPACPGQQIVPAACAVPFTANNSCRSPNQQMTLQATAFSKGVDITGVVGPFTWSQSSSSVFKVTPVTSSSDNVPTNQAVVTPGAPGFTPIFATAAGVSSLPYYAETCPVQCIAVELGSSGVQNSGQTSFTANKGTSQSVSATAVDVQGCVVPKAPLTWSSSQPASISAPTTCTAGACSLSTSQPGSGSVTASCAPPTCNIGFPLNIAGFVQPLPVYPVTPISGVVNGTATSTSVLATSKDCSINFSCTVALYDISTSNNLAGNPIPFPEPPNSVLFDPAGDKAYAGSAFGAMLITVANLGSSTASPFSTFTTARGKVLAVSENGNLAVLSDTQSRPNQVYVVTAASASSAAVTPLNISGANAAAFSPDGLKAFIIGCKAGAGQCPNGGDTLYVFSTLQALQTIPLSTSPVSATSVAFSSNGAFAFISETSSSGSSLAIYNTCNNAPSTNSSNVVQTIPLTSRPSFVKVLPDGIHIIALNNRGLDYITTTITAAASQTLCPQFISASSQPIPLGQGTFNPINFFVSPDGTLAYIVASDRSSVLVYDFNTNSVSGISLANNASPVSADITVDGTLIYVAGSDGMLHEVSTISAADLLQISFTIPSRFSTPFCSLDPTSGPCQLDVVAVKP